MPLWSFLVFVALSLQSTTAGPTAPSTPPQAGLDVIRQAVDSYRSGRWNEGRAFLEVVAQSNPYDGVAWYRYGFCLASLGQFEKAISAYEKALALDFAKSNTMYNLACAHARLGSSEQALKWLERALVAGFVGNGDEFRKDSDLDSVRKLPRFREITGYPAPSGLSRIDAWKYDLEFLRKRMKQVHYDLFAHTSERKFTDELNRLKTRLHSLSDHQIFVEIQKLLALVGDGHTSLWHGEGTKYGISPAPISLYQFSDGLFVKAASKEHVSLIGSRVLRLGTKSVEEAISAARTVCSVDNEMGARNIAPQVLSYPAELEALGVIESTTELSITVKASSGDQKTVTLRPVKNKSELNLINGSERSDGELPLYLRNRDDAHWFSKIPNQPIVYAAINVIRDAPHRTMEQFSEDLFRTIDKDKIAYLIIDLRHNGGGNNRLNKPLVQALIRSDQLREFGHLFVIVGRVTFSAAMNLVMDIQMSVQPVFVGEPTGSSPNFVGESSILVLPCSELPVSCSSLFWQNSDPWDDRPWIAPHVIAELSSEDYFSNRDPAMDAILHCIAKQESDQPQ